MLFTLFIGFLLGVLTVLFVAYVLICDPFGQKVNDPPFIDQFKPLQIPPELRKFLKSGEDGQGISKWESTLSLTLFLHMFYQEHKDTRQLRRWFHKRLQLELNDITTRSAAGRLIQDIRIRDLCLGTKFPTINAIRVEKVEMAEDKESFENVTFLIDMDYTGGFETSIDVQALLGGYGNLSIKVTRLAGLVRLILSRKPYNHWTFSFVSTPVFEFDINSQIQGHRLKHVIPLITQQIKRALQRKHVWPNYKIRYRPIFPNPLLQPSPPLSAFAHVKLEGGLEVTILQCSRLKTAVVDADNVPHEVYCTVTLDQRPFLQSTDSAVSHSISVMLTFSRYDLSPDSGLSFVKYGSAHGVRAVCVLSVVEGSLAEKANFKSGDVIVAINNIPVRSERQVERLLSMKGDLMVLVERDLDDVDDQSLKDGEVLIGDVHDPDESFVCVGELDERNKVPRPERLPPINNTVLRERSASISSDSQRRHSLSVLQESTGSVPTEDSVRESINSINTPSDSINSSLADLNQMTISSFDKRPMPGSASVSRTESAHVPRVLVSTPSIDLRRTRSESELAVKPMEPLGGSCEMVAESAPHDVSPLDDPNNGEMFAKKNVNTLGRAPVHSDACLDVIGEREEGAEKKRTLTRGGGLEGGEKTLHPTGSMASIISTTSAQSGATVATGDEDDEESRLSRSRPASTRRQRLHVALAAGKRKVFDLIPQKKRVSEQSQHATLGSPLDTVEMGADAGEMADMLMVDVDRENQNRSPVPSCGGKKSPTEYAVTDEKPSKEKSKCRRLGRKKKGLSPMTPRKTSGGQRPTEDSPSGSSTGFIHSRTTRAVYLQQNVLWGQSLHFELDSSAESRVPCKYLNVTVHARESTRSGETQQTQQTTPDAKEPKEPKRPVLLGYTSLYIPQLIDDCRLTLSNCHREVFHLKPPTGLQGPADLSASSGSTEFSRHAGYDPRLLYGDVTLGFRYFPDGLPQGAGTNAADTSDDEAVPSSINAGTVHSDDVTRPLSPPGLGPHGHEWKTWTNKHGGSVCALCRGKIWLKSAACCSRCLVVCHLKCQVRANTGIVCTPSSITVNDAKFEDITSEDAVPSVSHPLVADACPSPHPSSSHQQHDVINGVESEEAGLPTSVIPPMDKDKAPYRCDLESVSRRARLKNKVSEKWTSWRKRKERADEESIGSASSVPVEGSGSSPVASIASCLSDVLPTLEGSPFISQVYFQPGNAYNEETIGNAKRLGKLIFQELGVVERKERINLQIDKIQNAIRETKDGRLEALHRDRRESEGKEEVEEKTEKNGQQRQSFEGLDERLQALAVLMLHYCAALQDCCEQEDFESEQLQQQQQHSDDLSGDTSLREDASASASLSPTQRMSDSGWEDTDPGSSVHAGNEDQTIHDPETTIHPEQEEEHALEKNLFGAEK